MEIIPEQYFAGSLTDAEKQQLFDAMDRDDALRDAFIMERNLMTCVRQQAETDPNDAIVHYRKFKKTVQMRKVRALTLRALKYAAIAALAVWLWSLRQPEKTVRETPVRPVTIETPSGHRTRIVMPDGTGVWLNARSKLTYPSDFSNENRHVSLEGEAFFEVVSDAEHPFTVSTDRITVNVTGTVFNVNAYPDETASVTLIHGKVDIITPDTLLTLKPNGQVTVTRTNEITHNKNTGTPDIYAWTNGDFYYLNKPLSDIAKDLERRFNVKISIENKTLADELFTYHASENITLDDILRHLKKTKIFNFSNFSKKEGLIIIF